MPVSTANDQHDDGDSEKERRRDNKEIIREDRESLQNDIERIKATLELRIERVKLEAKYLHGRYEGLKEAGFSDQQAMGFLINGWESEG